MLRTHSNGITLPLGLQSLHFHLTNINKKNVTATYNTQSFTGISSMEALPHIKSASTGAYHDSHRVQDTNEGVGEKN